MQVKAHVYILVYTMFVLELCRALETEKIDYCLVGGLAVALHGAIRGTIDADLVVALDEKTLAQVEAVLNRLGLESRLPLKSREVFQFRKEYISKRNLIAWSFIDSMNPIRQVDIVLTHAPADLEPVTLKIHGQSVRVASISKLIEMKQKAGRPQDLEDAKALLSLKDLRKERSKRGQQK